MGCLTAIWNGAYLQTPFMAGFMRRYGHFVAAVIVTTALCVDRVSAPAMPPQFVQMARQLAGRLAPVLCKAAPMAHLNPAPRHSVSPMPVPAVIKITDSPIHRVEYPPFRFRLPPPILNCA